MLDGVLAAADDERAAQDVDRLAKYSIALIVGLTIFGLLAAIFAPVALDATNNDDVQTYTQNTGETVEIDSTLDATLDSTNTGTNATYTLTDTDANDSVTKTIAVGSEATYNLAGGDVTVNVSEANAGNATAEFTTAIDYGWSGGASAIWNLIGVFIVLALLLFAVGLALAGYSRST